MSAAEAWRALKANFNPENLRVVCGKYKLWSETEAAEPGKVKEVLAKAHFWQYVGSMFFGTCSKDYVDPEEHRFRGVHPKREDAPRDWPELEEFMYHHVLSHFRGEEIWNEKARAYTRESKAATDDYLWGKLERHAKLRTDDLFYDITKAVESKTLTADKLYSMIEKAGDVAHIQRSLKKRGKDEEDEEEEEEAPPKKVKAVSKAPASKATKGV